MGCGIGEWCVGKVNNVVICVFSTNVRVNPFLIFIAEIIVISFDVKVLAKLLLSDCGYLGLCGGWRAKKLGRCVLLRRL